MLVEFGYRAPGTREELLSLLEERGRDSKLLAGGTDLLPNIRDGLIRPPLVIDLKKVPGFGRITFNPGEGLSIGPAVTISALLEDAAVRKNYPILIAAAAELGSIQIRNRATVVGNVVNASPCADMAPPLLCLGASVEVASRQGTRRIALKDFFAGVKATVLKPSELVERILVPAETAGARGGFLKLKRIKGHDLGIISVALLKHGKTLRVAIGSAAPTPILLPDLKASAPVARVCREALRAIRPIDDIRASREYREFMVQVFLRRLLSEVK